MGSSKSSAGHRSKRTRSHPAKKAPVVHPFLLEILRHKLPGTEHLQFLLHPDPPKTERRRRSWTREQLSDPNFLKVPASVWNNIRGAGADLSECMVGAEDTLTPTLAAGTSFYKPFFRLARVDKPFWDGSIETKSPKGRNGQDTYRYRIIDQATGDTILPKNENFDDLGDDEPTIKILCASLRFEEHTIILLRRICPDATMEPIQTEDAWIKYLTPTLRQGFYQIKRNTTYGWAPVVKGKKGRNTQLPTPAASLRSQ